MTGNFAKSPPARFSSDEDDRLIDFVMQHKILYDLKDPEFKNTLKKDLTWKEAGKVLNKEGGECKKRWKSIRDHYNRGKKEEKRSTGKAAKKKRAVYWEKLQFLNTVEKERNSYTNIHTQTSNEESAPSEHTGIEEEEDIDEDDPPIQASEHSAFHPLSQTETSPPSPHSRGLAFKTPASKTIKERGAVPKYLQERKEDKVHLKRGPEELARQPLPQEKDHEIDLFFKTMAATVKKLPTDLATKTKANVFNFVTAMELLNQEPPLPPTTGLTNIQYNENQSLYSSSTSSSPWNTPHSSHPEVSRTNYDIVYQDFTQAVPNEDLH
ncbi:transcription factor Adf-1 isoform X3 [Diaphorina citri]|uniref:Transcription factor Adf-1 isoform X2 n=1 Tax=Diaphorina citri TaxID=121845 RepID=A0A1S4EFV2_DIACI|nr:transcription factor Adf-1 isoform X2 [Diaphorina citri]XP_026681978.1 transcription factor Adf-1 isoform X3 [Diaphorina citri]